MKAGIVWSRILQFSGVSPLPPFAGAGFELHQALQPVLLEESGVDIGYRENPVIHPAFTIAEAKTLQAYALERCHDVPAVQWLEGQALWDVEPQVNRDVLGALVTHQARARCPWRLLIPGALPRRLMRAYSQSGARTAYAR